MEKIHNRRWQLLRNSLVFQLKLLTDGLRDFLLVPAALLATLLGIIMRPDEPDYYFNQVLDWGRASERWINLFGDSDCQEQTQKLDDLISKAEDRIRAEYEKGGLAAQTKNALDRGMDTVHTGLIKDQDQ